MDPSNLGVSGFIVVRGIPHRLTAVTTYPHAYCCSVIFLVLTGTSSLERLLQILEQKDQSEWNTLREQLIARTSNVTVVGSLVATGAVCDNSNPIAYSKLGRDVSIHFLLGWWFVLCDVCREWPWTRYVFECCATGDCWRDTYEPNCAPHRNDWSYLAC
ncbi:hypothetical protein EDD16DRAFT_224620 [Pisolithus croceorrhizus]|nr:hypothetical protein EDD16DRAFT_224620 [Pisolithus croceorrhizus]KAI6159400.1 hypothetical protein EDD17DRAFT_1612370 [Pisolithus thermaeus]